MSETASLPLLLLDNSSMISVMNQGQFTCQNISFEEAKHILEVHDEDQFIKCFSTPTLNRLSLTIWACPSECLNTSVSAICAPASRPLFSSCTSRRPRRNLSCRQMTVSKPKKSKTCTSIANILSATHNTYNTAASNEAAVSFL